MILKDIFGKALLDYYHTHFKHPETSEQIENIITWTNISDKDELPLAYLFRSYDDMPELEKIALRHCKGKILDVGCGAGNHALHLQTNGFEVKAIDLSEGAAKVCQLRGLHEVEQIDVLNLKEKFDTILLLMNGTGIFQTLENAYVYLSHLKSLLNPNGQILIDSTDILYMYQDENGQLEEDLPDRYYGELDYFYSYKGEEEYGMQWLYLDFEKLESMAKDVGLSCEVVFEGEQSAYLARLSK